MKTLQLISVRWWNASAYYGVSLAEALIQSGHPCIVGGKKQSPPVQKAESWHLPTFSQINFESLKPWDFFKNIQRLKSAVTNRQISLVNAHRPEDAVFALLVKRCLGNRFPVVRTVSDVRSPKNRLLNKYLHENLDYFIFSCKASYDRYQNVWPIFEHRSKIIYSAVDTNVFRPPETYPELRQKLGFSEENVVIGVIARLDPVKDHRTFLRAAAITAKKAPHARFLVAGESCNVTHAALKELAKSLNIFDRIVFLERDNTIDVRELIATVDIGVVSSKGSEVICRIAVEYMAMGKPQVVTDVNVLPEIVDSGQNGFVVPAGDDEAMAAELLRLVNDEYLRKKMGDRARRYAELRYCYPVFAEKTAEVYRQILMKDKG